MKRNMKAPTTARRLFIDSDEGSTMIRITVTNDEDKQWCNDNVPQFCSSYFHSTAVTGHKHKVECFLLETYDKADVINYIESHLSNSRFNEAGYRIADDDYVEKYGVGGTTGRSQILWD